MARKTPQQRLYLKEWREFRQLTQEQLADRIGISRVMVSKIERGLNPYHQAFLEAAAAALMCEPADFWSAILLSLTRSGASGTAFRQRINPAPSPS